MTSNPSHVDLTGCTIYDFIKSVYALMLLIHSNSIRPIGNANKAAERRNSSTFRSFAVDSIRKLVWSFCDDAQHESIGLHYLVQSLSGVSPLITTLS